VLYVGRITRAKGVGALCEAVPIVRERWVSDVRFIFAGQEKDTFDWPEGAEYVGLLPEAELIPLYKQADALVIPSIWPEAFPRAGLDAITYGPRIVGADNGGIRDILREAHGVSFDPEDIMDVAAAIIVALRMGRPGGYSLPAVFREHTTRRQLISLYASLREGDSLCE